jgi:methionyl-tRNA formyltransferase
MRFAITCVDRCLPIFEALLAEGWEAVKLFTVAHDPLISASSATVARAVELDIPIQISRMQDRDLEDLADLGCEALVCASYNWKVGDWRPYLRYGLNFHPSPLPVARGPYPAFRAILEQRRTWGVACHKLEPRFDVGDILDDEAFDLADDECHESLGLKTQMAFGRLAGRIGRGVETLWDQARPQGPGSYWKASTDDDRRLDFTQPVETILRTVRAFGLTESIAKVSNSVIYVRRAAGWTESHSHVPGAVVHTDGRRWVIAAKDGYIALLEWSPITLAATELVGRKVPVTEL